MDPLLQMRKFLFRLEMDRWILVWTNLYIVYGLFMLAFELCFVLLKWNELGIPCFIIL